MFPNWGSGSARISVALASILLCLVVAACGSSGSSSSGDSSTGSTEAATESASETTESKEEGSTSEGEGSSAPEATQAQVKEASQIAFASDVPSSELDPIAQEALEVAAVPLTAEQEKIIEGCLNEAECKLGDGQYSIGYLDGNAQAPIRKTQLAAFLAQLLQYPEFGTVYMADAQGDLQKFLSGFRSLMSRNVDVLTGQWDFASSLGSLAKQAVSDGIIVVPISQEIPGADEQTITFVSKTDVCAYGENAAEAAMENHPGGGSVAIYTGTPGNPFGAGWIPCATKMLEGAGWSVAQEGTTDWTPQGEQQAANALITSGKEIDAIIYDYTPTSMIEAYVDAGKTPPAIVGGAGDAAYYRAWQEAEKKFEFPAFTAGSQTFNYRVAVTAFDKKLKGEEVPFEIINPDPIVPVENLESQYDPSLPDTATFNNNLPLSLQVFAQTE